MACTVSNATCSLTLSAYKFKIIRGEDRLNFILAKVICSGVYRFFLSPNNMLKFISFKSLLNQRLWERSDLFDSNNFNSDLATFLFLLDLAYNLLNIKEKSTRAED